MVEGGFCDVGGIGPLVIERVEVDFGVFTGGEEGLCAERLMILEEPDMAFEDAGVDFEFFLEG